MRKNVLLIGGSRGIGRAMAQQLPSDNQVYVASRTPGEALHNVTHIPFDVSRENLDLNLLPDVIHGFAYCPGSIQLRPFKRLGLDTFKEEMDLNFFGLVKVAQQIISRMADGGSMVFFSTVATTKGMAFHTSIAAAKGAIEGFAKALAAEYAPKLRVNVIAPSLVDTPLAERLLNNPKKRETMAERHPLKRIGEANDIAHLAVFLLSSQSTWISGQVLGVDGGMSTLHMG
ncbi:MAG: SDR family oxidoreductase [Bacteroidota bacterium]